MPITAAQRLADALEPICRRDYPALAKRAGVVVREIERAADGTEIRPGPYLKLCAAIGIKAMTGEPTCPCKLADFDRGVFRLGVELRRRYPRKIPMRSLVKIIGRRVGLSTMSRVANAKPVSITSIIAICQWLGTEPEHYCVRSDIEKFHVNTKSQTREGAAA